MNFLAFIGGVLLVAGLALAVLEIVTIVALVAAGVGLVLVMIGLMVRH